MERQENRICHRFVLLSVEYLITGKNPLGSLALRQAYLLLGLPFHSYPLGGRFTPR